MVKNSKSRIFHGAMLGVCLLLCLVAIISSGSFAAEHNKIRQYHRDHHPYSDDNYCILFTHSTGEKDSKGRLIVDLSGGKTCVLAIWGEAAISVVSLILAVEFLVKAIIAVNSISFFALVELVILVLTGLFSFSVAFVISVGLRYTCNAMEAGNECSRAKLYFGSEYTKFYDSIHAAEVTAWIATLTLAGMSGTYFFVLFAYIYTRKRRAEARRTDEMHDHLTPVAEDDEEPALVK